METNFELFEKDAMEKNQMLKLKGGGSHWEIIDGKLVLIYDPD
jgi:hypothetical protein